MTTVKTSLAILCWFLLCSLRPIAQEIPWHTLDPYFDSLEKHEKFMGNVAVWHKGALAYQKSLGYAQIESASKAHPQTPYRIGSISKTFTAALIFQLIERGKLDLHQSISSYFPTLDGLDSITLAHLLGHRSGLFNFTDAEDYFQWNTEPRTEEQMLQTIGSQNLDFEPGTQAAYSNANYLLLSYLLEKIYQQPFHRVLEEQICSPLGLSNTYFGYPPVEKEKETQSYAYTDQWVLQPQTHLSIAMGGGGILSTGEDLLRFAHALFSAEMLGAESIKQMTTLKDGFGMGLFAFPLASYQGWGHTGGIDGFSSILTFFEDLDLVYVLLSNGANYNTNDISLAVLGLALGQAVTVPSFEKYAVEEPVLRQYLGIYSSADFPLAITVTLEEGTLRAQASGQGSFALSPSGPHQFRFDPAGIVIEFLPASNEMILNQMGMRIRMTKKQ
jgi:D-alanyl-D-alanine carboxypeptidase